MQEKRANIIYHLEPSPNKIILIYLTPEESFDPWIIQTIKYET